MDPDKLVATVCEYLVNMRATNSDADWSSSPTTGTSRHAWLYRRASESCASDIMAFEFHRTVAPVVEAYRALVAQPVSAWGDVTSTEQHNEAIARLCYQFWLIAERHAPGQVVVPTNRPVGEPDDTPNYGTDELAPPPPVTVDTVLYECQMNIHLRAWRPAPHACTGDTKFSTPLAPPSRWQPPPPPPPLLRWRTHCHHPRVTKSWFIGRMAPRGPRINGAPSFASPWPPTRVARRGPCPPRSSTRFDSR